MSSLIEAVLHSSVIDSMTVYQYVPKLLWEIFVFNITRQSLEIGRDIQYSRVRIDDDVFLSLPYRTLDQMTYEAVCFQALVGCVVAE